MTPEKYETPERVGGAILRGETAPPSGAGQKIRLI
jgi:hypothetical protein